MHSRFLIVPSLVFAAAIALSAQTTAPNSAGVFSAHTHLNTTDLAASSAFWTAIGGADTQIGSMNGVRMPGLYILFQMNRGRGGARGRATGSGRAEAGAAGGGAPAGPPTTAPAPATTGTAAAPASSAPPAPPESSVGSVVEAIGIKVRSLSDTLAKLASLGVRPESGATATTAAVMSPERVKVLLTEDTSLSTSCKTSEWVMRVPDPPAAAAWYQKWFGATVAAQAGNIVAQIPGMNLRFVQSSSPMAGTKGRALDHIGFDVTDLPALVTKMQAEGVTVNSPYRTINLGFLTGLAFVTDPWGTYIELNQGYEGH